MAAPNKRLTIFSWALYDFANAIFAMNVIALYFALWVTVDKGAEDIVYSLALGLSMFLAAISMPILGAISDKRGRKMPYLIFFTVLSVIFIAIVGLINSLILGLIFFAISNFGYLISGAVFYNALLPFVADKEQIGRVSGYGIALSYFGTIAGLLIIRPIALGFGYQATFMPTALFFLLFALPCFLFVKDKSNAAPGGLGQLIRDAFKNLLVTLSDVKNSKPLFNFFLAVFVIINVVNTVFIFMSVYLRKVILFSDSEIITLYTISAIFSIIGALVAGLVTDKIGAKNTLTGAVSICCVTIFLSAVSSNKLIFWIVGPLAGVSFSAIRGSGRALAIRLFSQEKMGEVFGLLGFLSNLAFIGLLVWGLTVFLFSPFGLVKYRIALFISFAILVLGRAILQKAPSGQNG